MAYRADWQPLFTYIATELEKQSRIREFIDGEAHVKGFLLAYLNMTNFYQLMPEYELGKATPTSTSAPIRRYRISATPT